MIKIKQLAIFMDDTNALLMELYNHMIVSRNIVFRSRENEEYIDYTYSVPFKSTDEQWHHWAYYKELGDIIRNYQQVVLFGPVGTKEGLYKLLEADHYFKNTKIELVNTNIMTEFQIHDFVLEYYK
jgi:hypothetical protein